MRSPFLPILLLAGLPMTGSNLAAQALPEPYVGSWPGIQFVVVADTQYGVHLLASSPLRLGSPAGEPFHPDSLRQWVRRVQQRLAQPGQAPSGQVAVTGLCQGRLTISLEATGPRIELWAGRKDRVSFVIPGESELKAFIVAVDRQAAASRIPETEADDTHLDSSGAVYSYRPDDVPVEVKFIPQPAFPAAMLTAGLEGIAWLRYTVDVDGHAEPDGIRVLWSNHPTFGTAAVSAIRKGGFHPARIDGKPVRTSVIQAVTFRFEDPKGRPSH
jgi:hypothetical protein